MKKYVDIFGNSATIEKTMTLPYKTASRKTDCYRLSLYADYENHFLYHVSCHETMEEAIKKLLEMSCGTFKEC